MNLHDFIMLYALNEEGINSLASYYDHNFMKLSKEDRIYQLILIGRSNPSFVYRLDQLSFYSYSTKTEEQGAALLADHLGVNQNEVDLGTGKIIEQQYGDDQDKESLLDRMFKWMKGRPKTFEETVESSEVKVGKSPSSGGNAALSIIKGVRSLFEQEPSRENVSTAIESLKKQYEEDVENQKLKELKMYIIAGGSLIFFTLLASIIILKKR